MIIHLNEWKEIIKRTGEYMTKVFHNCGNDECIKNVERIINQKYITACNKYLKIISALWDEFYPDAKKYYNFIKNNVAALRNPDNEYVKYTTNSTILNMKEAYDLFTGSMGRINICGDSCQSE